MADYGLKISKTGADAGTSTGNNLILTSATPLLKISADSRITVGSAGTTIAHGFSYIPIVWCFLSNNGTMSMSYYDQSGDNFYVDGTNIFIKPSSGSKDFYYYIFFDKMGNYG